MSPALLRVCTRPSTKNTAMVDGKPGSPLCPPRPQLPGNHPSCLDALLQQFRDFYKSLRIVELKRTPPPRIWPSPPRAVNPSSAAPARPPSRGMGYTGSSSPCPLCLLAGLVLPGVGGGGLSHPLSLPLLPEAPVLSACLLGRGSSGTGLDVCSSS